MIKAVEVLRTFQGEVNIGKRVLLIRFKECNNNCYFCDTKNKLRDMVESIYELDNIQNIISNENRGLLITGGEPLFNSNFDQTVKLITTLKYPFVDLETNGCNLLKLYEITKDIDNINYIFSPKLFHNGQHYQYIKECISIIGNKLIIKILEDHSKETIEFIRFISNLNFNQNIYLMPLGKTKEEIMKGMPEVISIAQKYGFNITTRMHLIHDFE
jgi:organic radical activating enzyme